MAKIRPGGFVFLTWKGDHSPRHVHVYKDSKFVVKWNLDDRVPMRGRATARILGLIRQLESEGRL